MFVLWILSSKFILGWAKLDTWSFSWSVSYNGYSFWSKIIYVEKFVTRIEQSDTLQFKFPTLKHRILGKSEGLWISHTFWVQKTWCTCLTPCDQAISWQVLLFWEEDVLNLIAYRCPWLIWGPLPALGTSCLLLTNIFRSDII